MPAVPDLGCFLVLAGTLFDALRNCSTKSVSLEASLSMGMMKRKKKIERMANPLAVRV